MTFLQLHFLSVELCNECTRHRRKDRRVKIPVFTCKGGYKESSENVLGHNRRVVKNTRLPEYEREVAMRNRAVRYNAKLLIHCLCMYTDLHSS
jgi:hypothetical protein